METRTFKPGDKTFGGDKTGTVGGTQTEKEKDKVTERYPKKEI